MGAGLYFHKISVKDKGVRGKRLLVMGLWLRVMGYWLWVMSYEKWVSAQGSGSG